uniref:Uncharacterized protein n=1 Tax=Mola mola TaxID=94237 RepID=A0A3Q3X7Q0_MOLML
MYVSAGILKIITEKFLPHIGLPELEEECFSKILPKAVSVFHSMMEELLDQVAGLSSQNTELCSLLRNILQAMMQLIDTMSSCVRHVGAYEDPPDLDAIRSLPTCILKVLRETFQHCKDSEVVYCGRLSLVADLLQGLFKEAYTLQKGLLELLDKMTLNTSSLSSVGECLGSAHLPTRGGSAALVHWQSVLRRDTQVINRCLVS